MSSTHSISGPGAGLGLTPEHQELLMTRYYAWGLDRVRKELARTERDTFVPPEITEFARRWVAAEEKVQRWKKFRGAAATYFGIMLGGTALATLLSF